MNELIRRLGGPVLSAVLLYGVLAIAGFIYASGGSDARDSIVTQMMINAIIVIGMQIYIGNTGVLSFGHVGFGAVAGGDECHPPGDGVGLLHAGAAAGDRSR